MISIIIPILNEAETIEDLLFHLIDHSSLMNISEIIVVDGGSTDGSQDVIKNLDLKIKILSSPKGRAKQMNLGAKMATGDILYFLHADSFPPLHFDELIISEVKKGIMLDAFV
jgi:glycosyltransferase involved in cell wall biosynthesis